MRHRVTKTLQNQATKDSHNLWSHRRLHQVFGCLRKHLVEERGSAVLLTLLMMVGLLGASSLAIDLGVLVSEQQKMQAAADAGAIAGVQDVLNSSQTAANTAIQYATENDNRAQYTATADTTDKTVQVVATETTSLWFARVIGIQHGTVSASSTAEISALASVSGAVPLAVTPDELQFGVEEALSVDAGNGSSGNYGFLDFDGSSNFSQDLAGGYNGQLYIGQQVDTLTGVRVGQVEPAINTRMGNSAGLASCSSMSTATDDCSRVMIVPVVDTLDVNGKKPVTIIGFAAFYLDGLSGSGGQEEIMGQFMHLVTKGTGGGSGDYGVYTTKLIH